MQQCLNWYVSCAIWVKKGAQTIKVWYKGQPFKSPITSLISGFYCIIGLNIFSLLEENYLSSKQEFVCSPKAYSLPIYIYMNIPKGMTGLVEHHTNIANSIHFCFLEKSIISILQWAYTIFIPYVVYILYTITIQIPDERSIKHSNHSLMCSTQVFTYVTSSLSYRVPESILNKQDIENIILLYILQHCSRGTTPNHKCWTKNRGADMY